MWLRFIIAGFFSITAVVLMTLQVVEFSSGFLQFFMDLFNHKS